MTEPDNDPTRVYAISPDYMERMIDWYLTPVIDKLGQLGTGFAEAHGEVKSAHDNQTPGWFGGEGHGDVKAATSSFLNEVGHQLEQLVGDQRALASSLTEYRTKLRNHITWARDTDNQQADNFRSIERHLDEKGW